MRRGIGTALLLLLLVANPVIARAGEGGAPAPAPNPPAPAPKPPAPAPPANPATPGAPTAPPTSALRIIGPRVPGKERDDALRKYGGTAETEKAVEAGLDWLERHAREGGGWDADGFPARCEKTGKPCDGIGQDHDGGGAPCPYDEALSAMAALAFLGHGHLPDPAGDARAKLVEKTLRGLVGGGDAWAQALSTEAFSEAAAMAAGVPGGTGSKGRWQEVAESSADRLLKSRGEDGGFGYIADMRKGSDTPFTAFVTTALVAARDAGVELPADLAPGVDRFLESLEEKEGKLAYLLDGRAYGYTPTAYNAAAAAAVRELLQVGTRGARHRAHLGVVRAGKPVWAISWKEMDVPGRGRIKVQIGHLSEIDWWYGAIAMFQRGGSDWSDWFSAAKSALLPHQRKDGCARGSWDPEGQYERRVGGRVMATALGVLILEEPYRHRVL